ncbi:MAG: TonB-dependent receptor plug domain-containing protein, partial [Campylobacter sp.]
MQICRILFIFDITSSFVFSSQDVLLESVVVSASGISTKKTELSKSELKKGQIFSERDLVRNETGITVTEGGRSGNNGYAIRGVDSDRVSLKIDGMEAVESFMPR